MVMLRIYPVVIEVLRGLRVVVARVGRQDPALVDQMRRAGASVALNLSEGSYALGGNVKARLHDALGSAAEVRACLDTAEALGYTEPIDPVLRDKLDRVIGTLYRLTRR
jgi:four helix bundle protein